MSAAHKIYGNKGGDTEDSDDDESLTGLEVASVASVPRKMIFVDPKKTESRPDDVFDWEIGHSEIPYHKQGDEKWNQDIKLREKRRALFLHTKLAKCTDMYWKTFNTVPIPTYENVKKNDDGGLEQQRCILREEYIQVYLKMAKALYKHTFNEGMCRGYAINDWRKDTATHEEEEDKPYLTKTQLHASLFEIADIWTDSAQIEAYVEFLTKLYNRITVVDELITSKENSFILTPRFKPVPQSVNELLETVKAVTVPPTKQKKLIPRQRPRLDDGITSLIRIERPIKRPNRKYSSITGIDMTSYNVVIDSCLSERSTRTFKDLKDVDPFDENELSSWGSSREDSLTGSVQEGNKDLKFETEENVIATSTTVETGLSRDTSTIDQHTSGQRISDQRITDQRITDHCITDQSTSDQSTIDQSTSDHRSIDQRNLVLFQKEDDDDAITFTFRMKRLPAVPDAISEIVERNINSGHASPTGKRLKFRKGRIAIRKIWKAKNGPKRGHMVQLIVKKRESVDESKAQEIVDSLLALWRKESVAELYHRLVDLGLDKTYNDNQPRVQKLNEWKEDSDEEKIKIVVQKKVPKYIKMRHRDSTEPIQRPMALQVGHRAMKAAEHQAKLLLNGSIKREHKILKWTPPPKRILGRPSTARASRKPQQATLPSLSPTRLQVPKRLSRRHGSLSLTGYQPKLPETVEEREVSPESKEAQPVLTAEKAFSSEELYRFLPLTRAHPLTPKPPTAREAELDITVHIGRLMSGLNYKHEEKTRKMKEEAERNVRINLATAEALWRTRKYTEKNLHRPPPPKGAKPTRILVNDNPELVRVLEQKNFPSARFCIQVLGYMDSQKEMTSRERDVLVNITDPKILANKAKQRAKLVMLAMLQRLAQSQGGFLEGLNLDEDIYEEANSAMNIITDGITGDMISNISGDCKKLTPEIKSQLDGLFSAKNPLHDNASLALSKDQYVPITYPTFNCEEGNAKRASDSQIKYTSSRRSSSKRAQSPLRSGLLPQVHGSRMPVMRGASAPPTTRRPGTASGVLSVGFALRSTARDDGRIPMISISVKKMSKDQPTSAMTVDEKENRFRCRSRKSSIGRSVIHLPSLNAVGVQPGNRLSVRSSIRHRKISHCVSSRV